MLDRLNQIRAQIGVFELQNALLTSKKGILASLDNTSLKEQATVAVSAVPSRNPSIFALSSIRSLTIENGLSVANFRIAESEIPENKAGRSIDLSFEIQGDLFGTLSFLRAIQNSAPLMRITSLRFSVSGITALTKITAVTTWSFLPQELDNTEAPIENLTNAERELLQKIGGLRLSSVSELTVSPPAGREDPFNF